MTLIYWLRDATMTSLGAICFFKMFQGLPVNVWGILEENIHNISIILFRRECTEPNDILPKISRLPFDRYATHKLIKKFFGYLRIFNNIKFRSGLHKRSFFASYEETNNCAYTYDGLDGLDQFQLVSFVLFAQYN